MADTLGGCPGAPTVRAGVLLLALTFSLAGCFPKVPVGPSPQFTPGLSRLSGVHGHSLRALAVSPDGRLVVSGDRDGKVFIWDLGTRTVRTVIRKHWRSVWALAISPDGKTLVTASDDLSIRFWDLPSGRARGIFKGHEDSIRALAFTPDGKTLISGSRDTTVRLWDMVEYRPGKVLTDHTSTVRALAVTPDGRTLASGSADDTIRLWSLPGGEPRAVLRGHRDTVHGLVITPDGHTLISGSGDQSVRFWDLRARRLEAALVPDRLGRPVTRWERWDIDTGPEILALALSPEGGRLAVALRDNTIRLVTVASRTESGVLRTGESTVYAMAFTPDSRFLVSGADDRLVTLWDLRVIQARSE